MCKKQKLLRLNPKFPKYQVRTIKDSDKLGSVLCEKAQQLNVNDNSRFLSLPKAGT